MNYEEKYNAALERARQFSEYPLQEDSATIVEYIFPELAESEDERIRKEILNVFKQLDEGTTICGRNYDYAKWIAWLEKQSEQPTGKVDTKFHVGDWISGYYTNYKVLSVNNEGYLVEDTDGNKINILFENEVFHRLFTIADAKDGDVLVAKDGHPFIFTGEFDAQDGNPTAYCGINSDNKFITGKGSHWTFKDGITPATEEQRELLFHKMKEAEYDWDAEKKELKKIEPKKLDADEVIGWLVANICDYEYYVKRFKQDFKY